MKEKIAKQIEINTVEIECSLINKTDTHSMSDEIEENVEYEGEYSTIENNME